MRLKPWSPFTSSPLTLLIIFVILLVILDVALVRVLRLGKVAWKRVDYVWLAITALGLISGAGEVRRLAASSSIEQQRDSRNFAYQRLLDSVRMTTGPSVWRTFVRSELSPPNFDEIQRHYDAVCKFAQTLLRALPSEPPDELNHAVFSGRPATNHADLREQYAWIDESAKSYDDANEQYHSTAGSAERTSGEVALAVLSPLLLAVALALRFTKVTGEIGLERAAAPLPAANGDTHAAPATQPEQDQPVASGRDGDADSDDVNVR